MASEGGTHGVHRYRVQTEWSGSTGQGYEEYGRGHVASAPPAGAEVQLSSDPAFLGDPSRLNPEQLVVMAASSCQLLSFLAAAARARVEVTAYRDEAEGLMPEDERPVRITAITLRPTITVAPGTDEERVLHLVEVAHRQCFVANSLLSAIDVEPTVQVADG
ncbi:MAG TPA: OsmC family protein [Acidimicrobiales bacterium]|nr:OsmC family protein [Acidimicrobiales bacterium]